MSGSKRPNVWQRIGQSIFGSFGGGAETGSDGENSVEEPPSINGTSNGRANDKQQELRASLLGRLSVGDVMVHRHQIESVEVTQDRDSVLEVFANCGHSRLPVYRDNLDNPVGFVHLKDVVFKRQPKEGAKAQKKYAGLGGIASCLRDVLSVPASMEADKLLSKMQRKHVHLALVIDEFGGVDGLVTIEDLVEQIVGEIQDEHDPEYEQDYWLQEDGSYLCRAQTRIDSFEPVCNRPLRTTAIDEDIDTLGGLVFTLAGNVPNPGVTVKHPAGLQFEVMESDSRRIHKLRVRLGADEKSAARPTV